MLRPIVYLVFYTKLTGVESSLSCDRMFSNLTEQLTTSILFRFYFKLLENMCSEQKNNVFMSHLGNISCFNKSLIIKGP